VCPGLVDATSAEVLDLLGQVLAGLGRDLVSEGDQMGVIDCASGAGAATFSTLTRNAAAGLIATT
jgi:hypothetical protein